MTYNKENIVTAKNNDTPQKGHIIRRLYDWVLSWADTRHASTALFILAFVESSFFPIPPDVLLIALCISKQKKSFRYALICSVGSVLGGMFGYLIGYEFFKLVGEPVINFYNAMETFNKVGGYFQGSYGVWAVAIAGFTPIPYKVFTIAAGVFKMPFGSFVIASALSRSARFYLVAALFYKYGAPIKEFIDKYFNLLCMILFLLIIAGFYLIKYVNI